MKTNTDIKCCRISFISENKKGGAKRKVRSPVPSCSIHIRYTGAAHGHNQALGQVLGSLQQFTLDCLLDVVVVPTHSTNALLERDQRIAQASPGQGVVICMVRLAVRARGSPVENYTDVEEHQTGVQLIASRYRCNTSLHLFKRL